MPDIEAQAEVGRFSLASSVASVNTHYISGLLTSMSPVRRTSLFRAAQQDEDRLRNRVVMVFVITTLLVRVTVAVFADELVRLLPAPYHGVAGVIPFALLGWTIYGIYMIVYRMMIRKHKRAYYVAVSVVAGGTVHRLQYSLGSAGFGAIGQALAMGATYVFCGGS